MTRYVDVPPPALPVREPVRPIPAPGATTHAEHSVEIVGTPDGATACVVASDIHDAPLGEVWTLDVRGMPSEGELVAAVTAAVHLGCAAVCTDDPVVVDRVVRTTAAVLGARSSAGQEGLS